MLLQIAVLALAAFAPEATAESVTLKSTSETVVSQSTASASVDNGKPTPAGAVCKQPIVTGPCKAAFKRWAFNAKSGKCERFIYGGCRGNKNRFDTKEACEKKCVSKPPSVPVCEQPIVTGPCKAAFKRWAFNSKKGMCEMFTYGGCGGNENRFETQKECEEKCKTPVDVDVCKLPLEVGPCEAAIPVWGFEGGSCVEWTYGGCQGNGNRFDSEQGCKEVCGDAVTDVCELDIVTGPCRARIPAWGFNGKTCAEFVYGGCKGNGNRFDTEAECEKACAKPPGVEVCDLGIDAGPCKAALPRWGFDGERCVEFTYGGCGGNSNRFDTEEECEKGCSEAICKLPTFPPDLNIRCLAIIPAWTYRASDKTCEFFEYGGCGATANLFDSEEDCLALCGDKKSMKQDKK